VGGMGSMKGTIAAILLHEEETKLPRAVPTAKIGASGALQGDSHSAAQPKRRLLATSKMHLDEAGLAPGDLREQIAVEGLDLDALPAGTKLRFGGAEAEVLGPCAPCLTIGGYLKVSDPEAFREKMTEKRGVFIRFDSAGYELSVGDDVEVVPSA